MLRLSKDLYDENNSKAINLASSFLKYKNYEVIVPNTEQFKKYDLQMKVSDTILNVEVEVKKVWKCSESWEIKWDTVDIPYRKKDSESHLFIMINNPLDTIMWIDMDIVKNQKVITKDTIYTKGEKFFSVPYNLFTLEYYNNPK